MKLSILMPALKGRPWRLMADSINDQILSVGKGEVEFLYDLDNGEDTSGVKRQRLVEQAKGKYICFVDDDDQVSSNYLRMILRSLDPCPDLVTFNLRFQSQHPRRRLTEIWQFGVYNDDRKNGRMTANHLCVWRKQIAEKVGWCPSLGYGDDQLWYKPLIAANFVARTVHIPHPIYSYMYNAATTQNQTTPRVLHSRNYFGEGLRAFMSRLGRIYIEVPDKAPDNHIWVRDAGNVVRLIGPDEFRQYCLVTLK